MACTTCGQTAKSTATNTTKQASSAEYAVGTCINCPTLSSPPTCNELRDLKERFDNKMETNRDYVSECSGASIMAYVDVFVEQQQCLMGHIIEALCAKADKK